MEETKGKRIGLHCILASLYFLMLPLSITTNAASNSFLKLLTIPIGGLSLILLIFYKRRLQLNYVHLFLALYTVCTVLTLFVDPSPAARSVVLGYFLNAALFFCLTLVRYNERELQVLESVQVLLLIFITAATLLDNAGGSRKTLSLFGQESDPNYFVGFLIFPLSVTLKRMLESRYKVLYAVLAGCALYAVLLSGSRGGVLAVAVTVAAFAVLYPKGLRKKLLTLGIMLAGIVALWFLLRPILPENILERMSIREVVESKGTYRGDIWASMLHEIAHSDWEVVFGRGLSVLHTITLEGKVHQVFAHNQYLQVLYNQGAVGLILFCALALAGILRCGKRQKCVAVAIIGMLALGISLSFNSSTKTFWNLIAYAAMTLPMEKQGGVSTHEMPMQ